MGNISIDPSKQSRKENYKFLIGSVLPRPTSLVTSKNNSGLINAAPFSFFNVVCSDPPMIGINCARKPGGVRKDTSLNISQNGEFVVHIVDEQIVELATQAAIEFPPNYSEVEEVGFTLEESHYISVPRIKEAKIQMECKVSQIIEISNKDGVPSSDFIIGEVVCFHIDETLYHEGRIDTLKLAPVGRLAGFNYTTVENDITIPRMNFEEFQKKKEKQNI
ncbi:flavin reductase family protein [Niallia sp. Krafla_26]|uniref:flavin reductase family protein n=1 Tax=Niallia sp. Krafla_26 TaxID=3064703 RepID=UPI003D167A9B